MVEEKEEKVEKKMRKEEGNKETEIETKQEKQFKTILIVIIAIAAALFIIIGLKDYFSLKNIKFDYHGFTYEKTKFGNITVYNTKVHLKRQEIEFDYNLNLRNDPFELDKIPVNITTGRLLKETYVSFSPEMKNCSNIMLSAWRLGEFLGALGIKTRGAWTEVMNDSRGYPIKNCSDAINETIIVLSSGSKTRIYNDKTYKDCFILEVRNCEILKVSERFVLAIIDRLKK